MAEVEVERSGPVITITLNRPEVRNAINAAMAQEVGRAIDELEADADLRVAILRGNVTEPNPVFCAGHDLKKLNALRQKMVGDVDDGEPIAYTPHGGFAGFVNYPRTKPVIAAVDGLATSGGLEIVLACDLVVASKRSAFSLAEVKWNAIAGSGALFRLPWAVGRAAALDIILTGDRMSAERAYQLGLVSTLVDSSDVYSVACGRAEMISRNGPIAIRESYRVASKAFTSPVEELWCILDEAKEAVLRSKDISAGIDAFVNKTEPEFKGA